jgi:hypothetical protein
LHQPTVPPVYDGIPTPPEPYRWVSPPADLVSSNLPPLHATATIAIKNGQFPEGSILTGDNQVFWTLGPGSLNPPAGATSVTCTIDPLNSPPPAPTRARIRGNVYRLACVASPGSGVVSVTDPYVVRLRYPPGPFDQIQFYDGQRWHALATTRDPGGNPWARASVAALGDVAATARLQGQGGSITTTLQEHPEIDALLALGIVVGVTALVLEIRRRRKPA